MCVMSPTQVLSNVVVMMDINLKPIREVVEILMNAPKESINARKVQPVSILMEATLANVTLVSDIYHIETSAEILMNAQGIWTTVTEVQKKILRKSLSHSIF